MNKIESRGAVKGSGEVECLVAQRMPSGACGETAAPLSVVLLERRRETWGDYDPSVAAHPDDGSRDCAHCKQFSGLACPLGQRSLESRGWQITDMTSHEQCGYVRVGIELPGRASCNSGVIHVDGVRDHRGTSIGQRWALRRDGRGFRDSSREAAAPQSTRADAGDSGICGDGDDVGGPSVRQASRHADPDDFAITYCQGDVSAVFHNDRARTQGESGFEGHLCDGPCDSRHWRKRRVPSAINSLNHETQHPRKTATAREQRSRLECCRPVGGELVECLLGSSSGSERAGLMKTSSGACADPHAYGAVPYLEYLPSPGHGHERCFLLFDPQDIHRSIARQSTVPARAMLCPLTQTDHSDKPPQ